MTQEQLTAYYRMALYAVLQTINHRGAVDVAYKSLTVAGNNV